MQPSNFFILRLNFSISVDLWKKSWAKSLKRIWDNIPLSFSFFELNNYNILFTVNLAIHIYATWMIKNCNKNEAFDTLCYTCVYINYNTPVRIHIILSTHISQPHQGLKWPINYIWFPSWDIRQWNNTVTIQMQLLVRIRVKQNLEGNSLTIHIYKSNWNSSILVVLNW